MQKIESISLETGKKYTLYSCSDSAMTRREEGLVTSVLPSPLFCPDYVNATRGKWRLGTMKIGRKRTEYHLEIRAESTLIIPGTGHLPVDHEAHNSFAMSATINIAATPEEIRELVAKNINPNFRAHDTLIAYPEPLNPATSFDGILVYPEAPTQHAVIERMRETLAKGDA